MPVKTLLIVNPRAGRMKIRNSLFSITEKLCAAGFVPTTAVTQYSGHATELAADAEGYDMIICSGGDGTLNEVISGVVASGRNTPIGYIPLGSTNDFAKTLGIPVTVDGALKNILNGTPRRLDVGRFNDSYFTDVGFFGAFSRTAYDTPQDMKNTLGFLAYVLEGIKDLPSLNSTYMEITANDHTISGEFIVCMVSNSNTIGGVITLDKSLVKMDDGLFELLLVERPQNVVQLHTFIRALRSGDLSCEGMTFLSTPKVFIQSHTSDPWTLDGERASWDGTADIEVIPKAVNLILS